MEISDVRSQLDAVIAGLAVVDIIGRPVNLSRPPKAGSLQIIESVTLTTGGNVSNSGIDLAKMGFSVGAITRVGNDGLGQFIRQQYDVHGLDTSGRDRGQRRSRPPPRLLPLPPMGRGPSFIREGACTIFRSRMSLRIWTSSRGRGSWRSAIWVCFPSANPGLARLFRTIKKETGVKILLDTGGIPEENNPLLRAVLPFVDIFIPSYDEAVVLTGKTKPEQIVRFLQQSGASGVVGVKMGAKGCFIASGDAAMYVPALRVKKVVDATGAGDAFDAGFLAATLRGFDPFAAARIANAVAASCVTAVGASTAIKRFEDYETHLPHRLPFSLG